MNGRISLYIARGISTASRRLSHLPRLQPQCRLPTADMTAGLHSLKRQTIVATLGLKLELGGRRDHVVLHLDADGRGHAGNKPRRLHDDVLPVEQFGNVSVDEAIWSDVIDSRGAVGAVGAIVKSSVRSRC